MTQRIVPLEEVRAAINYLNEFNRLRLEEIVLTENGVPIEITKECLEEWRFIGLSNRSFVDVEFWKNT